MSLKIKTQDGYVTVGGNVHSVNGKAGAVNLTADDIKIAGSDQTIKQYIDSSSSSGCDCSPVLINIIGEEYDVGDVVDVTASQVVDYVKAGRPVSFDFDGWVIPCSIATDEMVRFTLLIRQEFTPSVSFISCEYVRENVIRTVEWTIPEYNAVEDMIYDAVEHPLIVNFSSSNGTYSCDTSFAAILYAYRQKTRVIGKYLGYEYILDMISGGKYAYFESIETSTYKGTEGVVRAKEIVLDDKEACTIHNAPISSLYVKYDPNLTENADTIYKNTVAYALHNLENTKSSVTMKTWTSADMT